MSSFLPSLTRPLVVLYVILILYVSLYPFTGWHSQGLWPWDEGAWLMAPWPYYWNLFDIIINLIGYIPLGVGLCLTFRPRNRAVALFLLLCCSALSFLMECIQAYLPGRVPSNLDWGLNTLGAGLGVLAALLWAQYGQVGVLATRWQTWRSIHLATVHQRRDGLLLLLWPLALLFPTPYPWGLGHFYPFWLAGSKLAYQGGALSLTIGLALMLPVTLLYGLGQGRVYRLWGLGCIHFVALILMALSHALSWGPTHAWTWWTPAVWQGWVGALVVALLCLFLSERPMRWLSLVCSIFYVGYINCSGVDAYFSQNVLSWEQGTFIRFYGLTQWLGWLWPLVVCVAGIRWAFSPKLKPKLKPKPLGHPAMAVAGKSISPSNTKSAGPRK
jgi:VanZ family protein